MAGAKVIADVDFRLEPWLAEWPANDARLTSIVFCARDGHEDRVTVAGQPSNRSCLHAQLADLSFNLFCLPTELRVSV